MSISVGGGETNTSYLGKLGTIGATAELYNVYAGSLPYHRIYPHISKVV